MRIVVVEPDADLLDVLGHVLRSEGHEVISAGDGVQGLRAWQTRRPQLVLLEADLPELAGWELCRRIRDASTTPIIMLTTQDDRRAMARARELGVDVAIGKPLNVRELVAHVRGVLTRAPDSPGSPSAAGSLYSRYRAAACRARRRSPRA